MLRQRLRARTSGLVFVGRVLVVVLAAALLWYGLMVVLLALKVSPETVNGISAYRTVVDWLAGLTPDDLDGLRPFTAAGGVLLFLLCGYLAFKEIPRPYLARHDLDLAADERGELIVEPRAVERLAETAAEAHSAVTSATSRYGADDIAVDLSVRRAREVAQTLEDAQRRVVEALRAHGLPIVPVNVTLTGYDRRQRRELS